MIDYLSRKDVKKATKGLTHGTKKKVMESFEGKKIKKKDFERGLRSGKISRETRRGISGRLDAGRQVPEPRNTSQTQKKTTGFFRTMFGGGSPGDQGLKSEPKTSRTSSRASRSYDKLRQEFGGHKGPGYTSDRGGSSGDRTSTSADRGRTSSSRASVGGTRKLH